MCVYKPLWYMGGVQNYSLCEVTFYIHPIDWIIRFYRGFRHNLMYLIYRMGIADGLSIAPIQGYIISIPIMVYWLMTGEYRNGDICIDCN